jgi:hypothetical protein
MAEQRIFLSTLAAMGIEQTALQRLLKACSLIYGFPGILDFAMSFIQILNENLERILVGFQVM